MTKINKDQFLLAREFIHRDISRELELANACASDLNVANLKAMGVTLGGGNFLAALAMLCYTEFAGGIVTGNDQSRANFDTFLRRMGPEYEALLDSGMNVYRRFRCGMAHEFFAKGTLSVSMFGNPRTGLGELEDGTLFFCLDKYFKDFVAAFDELGRELGFL